MKKVLEKILFFSPFVSFFVYTIMVAYAFVYSRVPNKSDALLFGMYIWVLFFLHMDILLFTFRSTTRQLHDSYDTKF